MTSNRIRGDNNDALDNQLVMPSSPSRSLAPSETTSDRPLTRNMEPSDINQWSGRPSMVGNGVPLPQGKPVKVPRMRFDDQKLQIVDDPSCGMVTSCLSPLSRTKMNEPCSPLAQEIEPYPVPTPVEAEVQGNHSNGRCCGLPCSSTLPSPSFVPRVMQTLRSPKFQSAIIATIIAVLFLVLLAVDKYNKKVTFPPITTFLISLVSLGALTYLVKYARGQLSYYSKPAIAFVVNATVMNIFATVIAITAIFKCQLDLPHMVLLGATITPIYLVYGISAFLAGMRWSDLAMSRTRIETGNLSLCIILAAPVLIKATYQDTLENDSAMSGTFKALKMSRGLAVILLCSYPAPYVYRLYSHSHKTTEGDHAKPTGRPLLKSSRANRILSRSFILRRIVKDGCTLWSPAESAEPKYVKVSLADHTASQHVSVEGNDQQQPEVSLNEDVEQPGQPLALRPAQSVNDRTWAIIYSTISAVVIIACLVLMGFASSSLIDNSAGAGDLLRMSPYLIYIIILPAVGCLVEYYDAIQAAWRDQMEGAIGLIMDGTSHAGMFAIPFVILLGWCMDRPTLILYGYMELADLIFIFVIKIVSEDRLANWCKGVIVLILYGFVVTAASFSDGSGLGVGTCPK